MNRAGAAWPGREKTKWRCRPGFYLASFAKDSIPGFGCLLSAFEHILRTLPKELRRSMANNPPKSKAELWTSIVDLELLCAEDGEKKTRTLVGAHPGWVFLKSQLHNRGTGWKNLKNRPLAHAPVREEIIGQLAMSKEGMQSRSTGFAWDFGSIVAGTKPSGRTVDSNKYISQVTKSQVNT